MSHPLDARERAQLCLRFDELGPDAPTLCEGWTTLDLAAHLVVRERRPLAGPGIALGDKVEALGNATRRAMAKESARGFDAVVERVRTGPPLGPFRVPRLRTQLNLVEYAIHHEDVRRANGYEVRTGVDDLQDELWRLLLRLAKLSLRRVPDGVGVELARPGGDAEVARRGDRYVRASGEPLELVLWANGRGDHARVELTGDEEAVEAVRGSDLSI
jgi:uncharacterized protein (TIGR03085 family)